MNRLPFPLSSRVIMGQRPTYEDENGFYSATSLLGSAALPFVISTGAPRSGEISVWMPLLGNVFRRSEAEGSAVSFSPSADSETRCESEDSRPTKQPEFVRPRALLKAINTLHRQKVN